MQQENISITETDIAELKSSLIYESSGWCVIEQIFKTTPLLSCVGGVLTAILLLLKPCTRRTFGVRWQCCVWLCVLAVMIIPARFSLPTRANSEPTPVQNAPV